MLSSKPKSLRLLIVALIIFQCISDIKADFSRKRMPGFFGVRGKKSYDTYLEDIEKRKIPGFMGVKGKKSQTEERINPWFNKKNSGFMGMRGKKSNNDDLNEMGMLIGKIDIRPNEITDDEKFTFINEILHDYIKTVGYNNDVRHLNELFIGKSKEIGLSKELDENIMSKLYDNNQMDRDIIKRSIDNNDDLGEYQKDLKSSYGLKRPYDFSLRGKFVGVRGKKINYDIGYNNESILNHDEDITAYEPGYQYQDKN